MATIMVLHLLCIVYYHIYLAEKERDGREGGERERGERELGGGRDIESRGV